MSDHHEAFPIGTKVQAVWSEDGEWYVKTDKKKVEISVSQSILVFFLFVLPCFSVFDYLNVQV